MITNSITQTQAWTDRKNYFAFLRKSAKKIVGLKEATDQGVPKIDGTDHAERNADRERAEAMLATVLKELREIKAEMKKNAAANKKGFDSLKPVSHQSLAELVKTLPPLQCEKEDENWATLSTTMAHIGETRGNLNKQRQRGDRLPFEGLVYGRDSEGRVWCNVSGSHTVFYLKTSLSGQLLSR